MKLEQKTLRVSFFIATFLTLVLSPSLGLCAETLSGKSLQHKETADSYLRQGQTTLAIAHYKEVLELNPGSTAVYFNLAIAYFKERNLKETISTLEKLVELDPNDYEAYYNLGCLKLYGKDFEYARDCFQKAQTCCRDDHAFNSTIKNSLELVDKLKNLDSQTQDLILLSLAAKSLAQ